MPRPQLRPGWMYDILGKIEVNTPVENADGQKVPAWGLFLGRWCGIKSVSGTEKLTNLQIHPEATHRIRMHADTETRLVTTEHRITFEDRIFDIMAVDDRDNKHVEITFDVTEYK